uniref:Uncharacterized protein n=1 Tax=mine drainage metagenome TaxID=410659 RepID=E6PUE0_9ZZZZ
MILSPRPHLQRNVQPGLEPGFLMGRRQTCAGRYHAPLSQFAGSALDARPLALDAAAPKLQRYVLA